jgi:hypothetical protein
MLTADQMTTLSRLPKSTKVLMSTELGPVVRVDTQQRTYLVNRAGYLISPRGSIRDALLRNQQEENVHA